MASFDESRLDRPYFEGAALQNARFYRCVLERPDFDGARLHGGRFARTTIARGTFRGSRAWVATLEDCDTRHMSASLPMAFIRLKGSDGEADTVT